MIVRPAQLQDLETIRDIAWRTWPIAYGDILSEEQIEYMLEKMYNHQLLTEQLNHPNFRFLIAEKDEAVGFCVAEFFYPEPKFCRIHKLYVLPDLHGTGAGKALMQEIGQLAKLSGMTALHLNVNRFNPAIQFYEKGGFSIAYEEDIDVGNGYLMEDYVMIREFD